MILGLNGSELIMPIAWHINETKTATTGKSQEHIQHWKAKKIITVWEWTKQAQNVPDSTLYLFRHQFEHLLHNVANKEQDMI